MRLSARWSSKWTLAARPWNVGTIWVSARSWGGDEADGAALHQAANHRLGADAAIVRIGAAEEFVEQEQHRQAGTAAHDNLAETGDFGVKARFAVLERIDHAHRCGHGQRRHTQTSGGHGGHRPRPAPCSTRRREAACSCRTCLTPLTTSRCVSPPIRTSFGTQREGFIKGWRTASPSNAGPFSTSSGKVHSGRSKERAARELMASSSATARIQPATRGTGLLAPGFDGHRTPVPATTARGPIVRSTRWS